jgi:RND family efflux transporter MFP subunit
MKSWTVLTQAALAVASLGAMGAFAQTQPVPTVVVQSRSAGASAELEGVVQAVKQSVISAQASGRIATLVAKAGDKVRKGQVLATIDDREAVAGVQRSQAQINQADAEMRNAKANYERTKDLQSKGFVSKAALDSAESQFKSASAARDHATAGAAQSSLAQGFTRVTAPFDGWVLQTMAEAGDLAVPGKPILTVYAPQPLRAVVQVPASRAAIVRGAAQTMVLTDDATQGMVPVSRSAVPSTDPVSQTTEWRFDLPTKEASTLTPGQPVRVQFGSEKVDANAVLSVPASAVVRRGELTAVFVVAGERFSLRAVRLGSTRLGDSVEVVSGIAAGDVVARDGIRAGLSKATPAKAAQ